MSANRVTWAHSRRTSCLAAFTLRLHICTCTIAQSHVWTFLRIIGVCFSLLRLVDLDWGVESKA